MPVDSDLGVTAEGSSLEGTVVMGVDYATVKISVSSHSSFLVPEPFSSHSLQVLRGHVADSGGNLSAGNNTVQVSDLKSVFITDIADALVLEEIVEIAVSGSEDLSLVELNSNKGTS